MPTITTVQPFTDGEKVEAAVLNRPINQLTANQILINNRVDALLNDAVTTTTSGWSSSKIATEINNAINTGADNSIVYAIALG